MNNPDKIITIDKENKIITGLNVKDLKDEEFINNNYVILCTKKGIIKKTTLEAYSRPRKAGINAINIREGDELLTACMTSGEDEVLMALRSGKAVRFNEKTVRPMGRTASGVKGITLASEQDEVIGMICINRPEQTVLVVSEKGFGKRTGIEDYRVTNRGGKGVKTLNITEKTGDLIAIKDVTDEDDLIIINRSGILIRIGVDTLRVMGRATQGVKLINLKGNDEIAAVTKVKREDEEEEAEEVEGVDGVEGAEPVEGEATAEPTAEPTEE